MYDPELRFAGAYEHAPWIAQRAFAAGVPDDPAAAMREVVEQASRVRQLDILQGHPDLAGHLAVAGELTDVSEREQQGAGLDRCTPEEFAEFKDLNARYRARFGFPFILALRGHDRTSILAAFRARVENDPETEFRTALDQIHRIAAFRIADILRETS